MKPDKKLRKMSKLEVKKARVTLISSKSEYTKLKARKQHLRPHDSKIAPKGWQGGNYRIYIHIPDDRNSSSPCAK